jgi:colicin import membrane protein
MVRRCRSTRCSSNSMRASEDVAVARSHFKTPALVLALAFAGLAGLAGGAHAQGAPAAAGAQSMEERLRAQLRITTSQLQQAQNELAALKAGKPVAAAPGAAAPAPAAEVEALRKDLARAQSQLAGERQAREQASAGVEQIRQQAQAAAEKSGGQIAQFRSAYEELLRTARASEAERQRLLAETGTQRTALTQCEAKNTQLYAVGQEVLRAYETMDMGSVFAARQPFAAQSRVKFEQIAQQYGDKLYEGRFDARAVNAPKPAEAAATPPAAAASAPAAK